MNSSPHTDPDVTLLASGSVDVRGRLVPADLPSAEELEGWLQHRQYAVQGFIGRGGMGAVYRGMQVALQRAVAIKIMRRRQGGDEGFEQRFHREALALAKLSHPGIVSVIDYGEAGPDYLFLVMEFVDGTDLMEVIRSRDVTQEMALALLPQICDALQFAHDQGIVHRDVKPSNILLTRDGRIKIADFGLAKHLDTAASQHTGEGVRLGTPDYAAPEQLEPGNEVDHRADIYALGVMIYQMLTGQLPRGAWKPPSERADVAADWDKIVSRAMKPEPDERYDRASEVKSDITRISTDVPEKETAKPSARTSRTWQFAMAVVLLATPLAWWLSTRPSATPATADAMIAQPAMRTAANEDKIFANSLGMKFVPVPGTKVLMCIHETRRRDYAVFAAANPGVDETWQKVMDKGLPVSAGDDDPVAAVSWNDASAFCDWLSKKERKKYRLPTELEWGLAVVHDFPDRSTVDPKELWQKLSTQVPWLGGNDPENPPDDGGNYRDSINDFATTAPVMSFKPNELGIYDLSGNVWEWCDDWAESQHINKVLKGCGWKNFGTFLRSGNRVKLPPDQHGPPDSGLVETFSGFRCVLDEGHIVATSVPPVRAEPPSVEEVVPTTMRALVAPETPFINSLGMKFVPVPGTDVLMCIHETRKQDYLAYSRAVSGVNCAWKAPLRYDVPISDKLDQPVVSTNWDDARQFCLWLSKREGRTYRLPTDREWSEAVGIAQDEIWDGNATPQMRSRKVGNRYPWGTSFPPTSEARCGNFADTSLHEAIPVDPFIEGYTDGYATTAPVMSFKPNNLGVYDLGGNIWEWVEEWMDASQVDRVLRGASFICNAESYLVSSMRQKKQPSRRDPDVGFRCVLEHSQAKVEVKPVTTQARKEQPLTNSLGMKFVPVPGSTVLMCIHETRRKDYAAYAKANEGVDTTWEHIIHQGVPVADGDDHSVAGVSWDDATAFCEWLGRQEGKKYRLPTEFEWNLAVVHYLDDRSRVTPKEVADKVYWQVPWVGDTNVNPPPDDAGNYRDSQKQFPSTTPVMNCKPNELGIYDLGGNVWELVSDWWNLGHTDRVLRGGSWDNARLGYPLSSFRGGAKKDSRRNCHGFRIVVEKVARSKVE